MALILDAELAAAQDNHSRRPIVEIISAQKGDDIPFDGTFLTPETFNEYSPSVIAHSSGRLCLAYCYGPDADEDCGIKYVYTDTDRTVFNTVTIELYTNFLNKMKSVSICEMTDGNIGIVALVDSVTNHVYRLVRMILTVEGVTVSSAEIANWSHDTYTADPWVSTIGTDSYLLVYGKADGSGYYIYKRTSADFITWSAESALSIGGLPSTWRLANPSILKITTGDLWLFFDALESVGPLGEELTNVYYSVSSDSGAIWANAVKMTAYDSYGEIGLHPTGCQKAVDKMHMMFTRQVGALHMDETATGWPTGDTTVELSWDSANRKLYAVNCWNRFGSKYLQCVVKIDVDTWTVDQYWDSTTTPGFPSFLCDHTHGVWYCNKMHDGHHIAICCVENSHRFIWHLDGEANTITGYYADTLPDHSITANMSLSVPNHHYTTFSGLQVDASSNRIYAWIVSTYLYHPGIVFGYIDLTETSDYSFHVLISAEPLLGSNYMTGISYSQEGGLYVDAPGNRLILAGSTSGLWEGFCKVYDLTSGGELCSWVGPTDTNFPIFGLRKPFVYGDKIYAAMGKYTSGYGQSSFRGLCEIDMASKAIKLHRPSYCTDDDHFFGRPNYVGENKLAMNHLGYGIAVFDMVSHTWELFSNANIPGMTLSGMNAFAETQIAYDATNDIIFVGDPATLQSPSSGVIAFSVHGYLRQSYYSVGAFSGGAWSFATALPLVQGFRDFDAVSVPDPSAPTSMYCFWISEDADGKQSIKWDKDGSSLDLSDYLTNDEITVERTIDGNPATLSFSVSHGHLFDPYNSNSLLSMYLKKGRKLTIRFGELISGVENWQNQGTFYVQSGSIRLSRGEYPIMKIEALDQRALWQHSHVYATDIYSNTGVEILTDLMTDIADMALAEIDTFTIDGDQTLDHQWIGTTLDEVLTQVCNRFGSYYRFTVDGKFSVRKITKTGTVTHIYTDQATIIAYTPDDKYSDYTNRVTVIGQERDFTTVTFAEEQVGVISGTLGWWGCMKEHVVWFSTDRSRRCVNPRMVVIETASSIPFQLEGSVDERIEQCSDADDNRFCTVIVEAPNLIGMLAGGIGTAAAGAYIGDQETGEETISIGKIIEWVGLNMALMVLGSVANYQYEIWAQPLGSIRRSVQATANDTEHQAEIGCVVEQKIEDPLCYSVADCAQVAAFELMVAQMQRKRVSITKVAHLQDEDGDTIRFVHPISGANIDIFVTNLRRKFKKGADGYFLDEIDGWVVNQ